MLQFFFTTDIYTRLPITPNSKGSKQSWSTWCPGAPDLSNYRHGVLERPVSQIIDMVSWSAQSLKLSTRCPGAPDLSNYRHGVLERPSSQIIVKTRQYFDLSRFFKWKKKWSSKLKIQLEQIKIDSTNVLTEIRPM